MVKYGDMEQIEAGKRFLKENKIASLIVLAIIVVAGLLLIGIGNDGARSGNNQDNLASPQASAEPDGFPRLNEANPTATLKTSMGDITFELYQDLTPITANNFIELAESGFYNNTKFHRVIDNFMIQGGDPNTTGSNTDLYGRGGPGYTIQDEFVEGLSNLRGTIAMANIGQPNSGGSQFFINYTNNVGLDFDKQPATSRHPVFGHVINGMNVVDSIVKVPTGSRDIPLTAVVVEEVVIIEGTKQQTEKQSPEEEEVPVEDESPSEDPEENQTNPEEGLINEESEGAEEESTENQTGFLFELFSQLTTPPSSSP